MANKQQTAVEWFAQRIQSDKIFSFDVVLKKALQMERDQIKNAWISAWKDSMIEPLEDKFYDPDAERYYNEAFSKY